MTNAPSMRRWLPVLVVLLLLPAAASAQGAATDAAGTAEAVRAELMGQFEVAMRKFVALAEAMPAESYEWGPSEEVMPVGQVYMHVARYNYLYPSQNMGVAAVPAAVDMGAMEAVREKEAVVAALRASHEWATEAIGSLESSELGDEVELYGRSVPQWAVLVQLVTHMNQHLGQAIAYARSIGVAPPWSR